MDDHHQEPLNSQNNMKKTNVEESNNLSNTPTKSKTMENISEYASKESKPEDSDEEVKKQETKFSFPKFLEKWKAPEALPLNLLIKRFKFYFFL